MCYVVDDNARCGGSKSGNSIDFGDSVAGLAVINGGHECHRSRFMTGNRY